MHERFRKQYPVTAKAADALRRTIRKEAGGEQDRDYVAGVVGQYIVNSEEIRAPKRDACPHCGRKNAGLIAIYDGPIIKHAVTCRCGMQGPEATTPAQAVKMWNGLPRKAPKKNRQPGGMK